MDRYAAGLIDDLQTFRTRPCLDVNPYFHGDQLFVHRALSGLVIETAGFDNKPTLFPSSVSSLCNTRSYQF